MFSYCLYAAARLFYNKDKPWITVIDVKLNNIKPFLTAV